MPWKEYLRRWDADDRALVVAVLLEEGAICQLCGTAPWEWQVDGMPPYVAMTTACPGCAAKDRHNDAAKHADKQPGSSVRLLPRVTAETLTTQPTRRPRSPRELAREARHDPA